MSWIKHKDQQTRKNVIVIEQEWEGLAGIQYGERLMKDYVISEVAKDSDLKDVLIVLDGVTCVARTFIAGMYFGLREAFSEEAIINNLRIEFDGEQYSIDRRWV